MRSFMDMEILIACIHNTSSSTGNHPLVTLQPSNHMQDRCCSTQQLSWQGRGHQQSTPDSTSSPSRTNNTARKKSVSWTMVPVGSFP
uniref:Uncharacterized protein n=1 Tax=Arundo donax TaxID=35708 RepID=A0A0A9DPB9_ARUDO